MRRKRCMPKTIGCLAILLGITILLSLIFPPGFWWFVLGVTLIACGIAFLKSCRRR